MKSITRSIVLAAEAIAAVGIFVCVVVNIAQVLLRYVFFAPLPWSEEVMRFSMVWVAMLGAVAAIGRSEFPAVKILAETRSKILAFSAEIAAVVCVCAFCLTLIFAGGPTLRRALATVSPAANIPLIVPYAAVFIGSGLVVLVTILVFLTRAPVEEPDDND